MTSLVFSPEQTKIILTAITGKSHVVVDAVAGSGKTTTVCGIAQSAPTKKVVLLTFNKNLTDETKVKAKSLGIRNLTAMTVHGLVYRYYCSEDKNDRILTKTIAENLTMQGTLACDLLVLDEFQDFNELMVKTVLKVIHDLGPETFKTPDGHRRLILLGDKYQCVYDGLKQADNRYLIHAKRIFGTLGQWSTMSLHTTFRLTHGMTDFINDAVLKSSLLKPNKKSRVKPVYYVGNLYSHDLHQFVLQTIRAPGIRPDDVFILTPSVKSSKNAGARQSSLSKLTNYLSDRGIPIYYTTSDIGADKVSPKELENKLVVSTYHSSKGRERKIVFLMGFDASYFDFYARDKSKDHCANAQYVALTRAKEQLIILRDHAKDHLSFLDKPSLERTCTIRAVQDYKHTEKPPQKSQVDLTVSELLEYMQFETLCKADEHITQVDSVSLKGKIDLASFVETEVNKTVLTENVSDLNGTLITLLYELHKKGQLSVMTYLREKLRRDGSNGWLNSYLREKLGRLVVRHDTPNDKTGKSGFRFPQDMLILLYILDVDATTLQHRVNQLKELSPWFTKATMLETVQVLDEVCSQDCQFEVPFIDKNAIRGKILQGRVDIVDHGNKALIEVKYVDQILDEHRVQLLLYAYLARASDPRYHDYKLQILDAKRGRLVTYASTPLDDLHSLVDYFIHTKYAEKPHVSDAEFIRKARGLVDSMLDGTYFLEAHKDHTPKYDPLSFVMADEDDDLPIGLQSLVVSK